MIIFLIKVIRGECKGGFFAQFSTEEEIQIAYKSLLKEPFGKTWLDIKPSIGGISSLGQGPNEVKFTMVFSY